MPEYKIHDEKAILKSLSQGSELAFGQLYALYSARLFGNLLKITKSETVARELLQDVFIKIWDNRQSIDPDKSFRSYLFKIAENKIYDFLRKTVRDKKLYAQILAAATAQYTHIEEKLLAKENISMVQTAIGALSPQRQQVFRLCKMEGRSYEEVSTLLGISTSTISDHIVKATRSIHQYINRTYGATTSILLLLVLTGL